MMARFVKDVSINDGTQIEAGALFTKTWTMRNDSVAEWPEAVHIMHVGGDAVAVDGAKVKLPVQRAQCGEEVDISVQLKAPTRPGRYVSYWRLMDRDTNHRFGHRVWVDFTVVAPKPVAVAVPVAAPTIVLTPAVVEPAVVVEPSTEVSSISQESALAVSAQLQQQQEPFVMVDAQEAAATAEPVVEPVVEPVAPAAVAPAVVAAVVAEVVDPAPVEPVEPVEPVASTPQWAKELEILGDMGFFDGDRLIPLLETHNGDVQRVIEAVL
jgi:next-to-BRCA1 protein 1